MTDAPATPPPPSECPVLVVAAHPDDPEFGCGGTSAAMVRAGRPVYYVVCTSGDKGSSNGDMVPEQLMELREAEQLAAARTIGVTKVYFLRLPDCELAPNLVLRRAIVKAIRTVRPTTIFCHDPTSVYTETSINHPDHQAVGHATLNAIYPTARDRLNFPEHEEEGLQPHKVLEVCLWGAREPNHWIDIGETIDTKVAALTEHKTQIPRADELAKRMRERAVNLAEGFRGEGPAPTLAEAFRRIQLGR
jgi:LmbE family N-acetylglucosaminyl deacetylase